MKHPHEYSQYIAEFIGTFFLVFFGCGAIILSELQPQALPNFIVPLIFGGTISIMIYSVGHISGAHFNPAVTLAFSITRKFPLNRVFGYITGQLLGALSASCIHWIIWGKAHSFGVTQVQSSLIIGSGLEIILSFVLMFVIISVATDTRAIGEFAGIAIGSTVTLCAFIGGPLTGASMNPARSLGPAIISGNVHQIWIYLVFTILGAALGAFTYEKIKCLKEESSDFGCC